VDRSPNSSVRAGNKAATHEHDFLSLYAAAAKEAPLLLHDSKAPPPGSQGREACFLHSLFLDLMAILATPSFDLRPVLL
jgi:hypothetical protein